MSTPHWRVEVVPLTGVAKDDAARLERVLATVDEQNYYLDQAVPVGRNLLYLFLAKRPYVTLDAAQQRSAPKPAARRKPVSKRADNR